MNLPTALPRKAREISPVRTHAMVLFVFIYLIIQFASEATKIIGIGVTVQIVWCRTQPTWISTFLPHPE
jgi:hypothetical protein